MSLSQVRTYFEQRLLVVSPKRKQWKGALDVQANNNVPQTILDTSYHIKYDPVGGSTQNDRHIEDSFLTTLTIWKRGFKEPTDALDIVMDEASCIRLDVLKHLNMHNFNTGIGSENLQDIVIVSVTPSEIDASNDNTIEVQLIFNVRLFFGID